MCNYGTRPQAEFNKTGCVPNKVLYIIMDCYGFCVACRCGYVVEYSVVSPGFDI